MSAGSRCTGRGRQAVAGLQLLAPLLLRSTAALHIRAIVPRVLRQHRLHRGVGHRGAELGPHSLPLRVCLALPRKPRLLCLSLCSRRRSRRFASLRHAPLRVEVAVPGKELDPGPPARLGIGGRAAASHRLVVPPLAPRTVRGVACARRLR